MSSRPRLESVGRIALVVMWTCVVVVSASAAVVAWPALEERWRGGPAAAYDPGDRIDVAAALWRGRERTVLVFARRTCPVSRSVTSEMAALVDRLRRSEGATSLLVVPPATRAGELELAVALGLATDAVVEADTGRLRLRLVPTVVVVDGRGDVVESYEGAQAIRAAVRQGMGRERRDPAR